MFIRFFANTSKVFYKHTDKCFVSNLGSDNMTFEERIQKLIKEIQCKVLELEEEWERLDGIPQKLEERNRVAERILKLNDEIEGFEKLLITIKRGKK